MYNAYLVAPMGTKKSSHEAGLIAKVVKGNWQTGDKLPSERQMASEFHISRNTVRGVLRRFEAKGMITPRRGSGYFLTNTISATALNQQRKSESYDRIMEKIVTCTHNKVVNTCVAFSELKGVQLPFSIIQELKNE